MAIKSVERKRAIKEIQKVLWRRMKERGFDDVTSFLKASGLEDDMSFETVRRTLNDPSRPPSALSVGVIAQRLGFDNDQIIEMMQSLGDTYIYTLITPTTSTMQPWEEGLLAACRKLVDANKRNMIYIADALKLVGVMSGVGISGYLARLSPPVRTRKVKGVKAEVVETVEESVPVRSRVRKLNLD